MKKIYLLVLCIFVLPFFLSFFIKEIPNDVQHSLEGTQIIYKDVNVLQAFKSEMSNLSGIGMSIKNPYLRNRKDLILDILSSDRKLLRTTTVNGASILDGDLRKIEFEPIVDSKDKNYFLSLSSKDTEESETLEIFLTSKKVSWIGDLYINSNKQDSTFSFITYHRPNNILTITSEIFIQWGERLLADLPFSIFYIILIGSLTSYLFFSKRN